MQEPFDGLDRMLGAVFGLVRGAEIVGFSVMLAQAAELDAEPWWQVSRLLPIGENMADVLRGYVDAGREIIEETLPES